MVRRCPPDLPLTAPTLTRLLAKLTNHLELDRFEHHRVGGLTALLIAEPAIVLQELAGLTEITLISRIAILDAVLEASGKLA